MKWILIFVCICAFSVKAISQSELLPERSEGTLLFESDEVMKLTLVMSFRDVLRDIKEEREEHPGHIVYLDESGNRVQLPLSIRTRGHFRRDPMNCNFPPLRLNFPKDSTAGTLFEGQNKIKLITHCRSRGDNYNHNVVKEYLAYRFYNLFTDTSYRVRLVELSYADSDGRKDTLARMGVLIEPTGLMAERLEADVFEMLNVRQEHCDPATSNILAVYQYMIGNTDWSIPGGHNIDLIRYEATGPPVPVPFDFDWSGLVDAPYAVPNEKIGTDDVKIRVFRGTCRSDEEFEAAFTEFRQREEAIFELIRTVPGLPDKEKKKIEKYIGQFFTAINNPKLVESEFKLNCLTR